MEGSFAVNIDEMSFEERCAEHDRLTAKNAPPLNKHGKPDWAHPDFSRCSNDWWRLGLCNHCRKDGGCEAHKQKLLARLMPARYDFPGDAPPKPCGHQGVCSGYTRDQTMTEEQRERLLTETQETAGRLNKLNAFMASDAFPKLPREDKDLLYSQQRVMSEYVQILGKRLERAGQQFEHAK